MKITKLGHCCLLIETKGKRILTDPGTFTTEQDTLMDIDIVLITHEHGDHFHLESLGKVIINNPGVAIVTNSAVGAKLTEAGIAFTLLEGVESTVVSEITLEAFDCRHEEIFEEIGQVQNTGYFIDGRLFYPGDSFGDPGKSVEILALPLAGPWCRFPDAIRYTLKLKPTKVFPVHDGMIQEDKVSGIHAMARAILGNHQIDFKPLASGEQVEYELVEGVLSVI